MADVQRECKNCKILDEKLELAGKCGLELHQKLMEAISRIDEMRDEHENNLGELVQEIYELKRKLECNEKLVDDQHHQHEIALNQLELNKEDAIHKLKQEINQINNEKSDLLSKVEQCSLKECRSNEKIKMLEEKVSSLTTENQQKRESLFKKDDSFAINESIFSLQEEVETCQAMIAEMQYENESLSKHFQRKTEELDNVQRGLEEAEGRATSYHNHLIESQEEIIELKAQIDDLSLKLKQSGYLKKGNSLFSEVEDERIMMMKKLKSMEIKYESLQKAHNFLKSQYNGLRSQVSALLSMFSVKADSDHIENLERALSQSKAENIELENKLKCLKATKSDVDIDDIFLLGKNLPDFESNKDIVDFLKVKLDICNKQIKKLNSELDATHMFKMAESDKLLTAETRLYEIGRKYEKSKTDNVKLHLALEETKNKLKAESEKRILIEKKFNYDSKNDVEPIGVLQQQCQKDKPIHHLQVKKTVENPLRQNGNLFSNDDFSNFKNEALAARKKYAAEKENKFQDEKNGVTNGANKATSTRKVSFKDKVDVIVNEGKEIASTPGQSYPKKETREITEVDQNVDSPEIISEPPASKFVASAQNAKHLSQENVSNHNNSKHGEKLSLKDDPACQVQ